MVYKIEDKVNFIFKALNTNIGSKVSTDSLYLAIRRTTGFMRNSTIRNLLIVMEELGYIEKDKEFASTWIIKKMPKENQEDTYYNV